MSAPPGESPTAGARLNQQGGKTVESDASPPGNGSGPRRDNEGQLTEEATTKRLHRDVSPEVARDGDDTATWARTFMGQVGDCELPLYGSEEFLAANGLVRLASAVRAAEAHRRSSDPHVLAAELDLELNAAWRYDEMDYDGWRTLADRVRRSAGVPDHAELVRRRAQ